MRRIRLPGRRVVLRAFKPSEVDALLAAHRMRDGSDGPVTRITRAGIRRRVDGSGRFDGGCLNLAIEAEGRLVGDIQARGYPKALLPPGVLEIGISLYDRGDRGRGWGREAVALLTTWLLTEGGAGRVQASTATTNRAMQVVLERTGYKKEGVMRNFFPGRRGAGDALLYARIKPARRRGTV